MENKEFIKSKLLEFKGSHDIRQVFEDFVVCSAYAISNSCNYNDDMEKSYLKIAETYTSDELNTFAQLLAHLQMEYSQNNSSDILGQIYMEIGLGDKYKGQFFTPEAVCNFMTRINISPDIAKKAIEEKGYFSINDPACGSGRFLFSALDYLEQNDIPKNKVYVEGADISFLCACMTYVGLSLKGSCGIVKHQNTLTNENWNNFYTPAFVFNQELQDSIKKENQDCEVEG